jgi:hypothetical protein
MLRLKPGSVRLILVAVAPCWVAALFYCIYVRNYEAPAILILAAFFTYFISQRKWANSGKAPDLFKFLRQYGSSPIRELAKGLAWLIGCLLVGLSIGSKIPDVQLGVAFALCVVVIGAVAFVLFLIRALSAWRSG